ncbi:MAG: glutaredoxin [Methylococcales bacterium]|jgi:glutaredoxin 3|nr:glutaredoxin [Methylococcales bacterium]MBT7409743.1 glutaredoxin [Methylococcales bacterium]
MKSTKVYSTQNCPICVKAKNVLTKWGIDYEEVRVDESREGLKEMSELTNGARTVPQITIEGKWIGGFSELTELHMDGDLDHLISN